MAFLELKVHVAIIGAGEPWVFHFPNGDSISQVGTRWHRNTLTQLELEHNASGEPAACSLLETETLLTHPPATAPLRPDQLSARNPVIYSNSSYVLGIFSVHRYATYILTVLFLPLEFS